MTEALESSAALYESFEPLMSDSDRRLWSSHSEHLLADMREAMRQDGVGAGWDNVAWIGAGTSTRLRSSVRCCSGMAPRTAWPNRSMPTGMRQTSQMRAWPCARAKVTYSPSNISRRCWPS